MRQKKVFPWFCLILVVLNLAGCINPINTPGATSVKTSSPPMSTMTPTQTPLPTSMPTPTAVPTLSPEDAHLLMLDLLANNGNCQLPCFLGIVPGMSTYRDVQTRLIPFSSLPNYMTFDSGNITFNTHYTEGDLELYFSLQIATAGDFARSISFNSVAVREYEGGEEAIYDSSAYAKRLAFYRLPNVLSQYGKPTSVLIKTYSLKPGRAEWAFFYIVLMYPEQGIFIQYTSIHSGLVQDKIFRGCPTNAYVKLELYPPGHPDMFLDSLPQSWKDMADTYKPLEEATSMSLDDFYETFSVPTDACIETSSRIWPSEDK